MDSPKLLCQTWYQIGIFRPSIYEDRKTKMYLWAPLPGFQLPPGSLYFWVGDPYWPLLPTVAGPGNIPFQTFCGKKMSWKLFRTLSIWKTEEATKGETLYKAPGTNAQRKTGRSGCLEKAMLISKYLKTFRNYLGSFNMFPCAASLFPHPKKTSLSTNSSSKFLLDQQHPNTKTPQNKRHQRYQLCQVIRLWLAFRIATGVSLPMRQSTE